MQISARALEGMERKLSAARNRVAKVKAEAEEAAMTVVAAAEVGGTAFALGVVNGRYGSPEILGIPADLGIGIAAHILGFMTDEGGDHIHNIANGALASYLSSLGTGIGQKMLSESRAPSLPAA